MTTRTKKTARPSISERVKLVVWGAAAGRCTLCNCLVTESEELGEVVPIGEIAHNIGWGHDSPRGDAPLAPELRSSPDNLILLCRNCHKPPDDGSVIGRYPVERLRQFKVEHEARIRRLTEIGADRSAAVIRVVGHVRGVSPSLDYGTVLEATTAAGYFPRLLPGSSRAEYDLDLRHLADAGTARYFADCGSQVDALLARVTDGVRRDEIVRLALFAFARIPVLIHLGARLDDKVETLIFQRQRVDGTNAWTWPACRGGIEFAQRLVRPGTDPTRVALIVNLSGTIQLDDLRSTLGSEYHVYQLGPAGQTLPEPSLFCCPHRLSSFDRALRGFLAHLEADHGRIPRVDLFPAVPISAAITLGRVLMPHVSPSWRVFDRDDRGAFIEALEVRR